jgi:hypothetical protein
MAPPSAILPELSRSYKAREHCRRDASTTEKKRKIPNSCSTSTSTSTSSNTKACYQVRPCPAKGGIAMFATRDITCGELIIAHEDPIVSSSISNRHFCHSCVTPLDSLRDHLQAPLDLPLPCFLESSSEEPAAADHDAGLCFTKNHSILSCPKCQQVAWCSDSYCQEKGKRIHDLLCSTTTATALTKFYESVENPLIFQLAAQGVALIIMATMVESGSSGSRSSSSSSSSLEEETASASSIDKKKEQLYWWRDYGSHPLWWKEVGSSPESSSSVSSSSRSSTRRREQTLQFCQALRTVVSRSIPRDGHSGNQPAHSTTSTRTRSSMKSRIVKDVCSHEQVGELLGMLQCNVMEFEYPSPVQQYMEHVEHQQQVLEEEEHGEEEQTGDNKNVKHQNEDSGLTWLAKNIHMPEEEEEEEEEEEPNTDINAASRRTTVLLPSATPVMGSGLYPLLTLANHDCDPNASIDFLQESNRGSMVALRDICQDEEICITYVENGDWDAGGNSDRFEHFKATRTWKWLNQPTAEEEEEDHETDDSKQSNEEEEEDDMGDEDSSSSVGQEMIGSVENEQQEAAARLEDDDEDALPEGSNQMDRAKTLSEYGFECSCDRCRTEKNGGVYQRTQP